MCGLPTWSASLPRLGADMARRPALTLHVIPHRDPVRARNARERVAELLLAAGSVRRDAEGSDDRPNARPATAEGR